MKSGDTFKTKLGLREGGIIGVYPQGQSVPITLNEGAYQITINGFKGIISRPLFDVLFDDGNVPVVEEEVVVPVAKRNHKHEHKKKEVIEVVPAEIIEEVKQEIIEEAEEAKMEEPVVEPVFESDVEELSGKELAEKIVEAVEQVINEEVSDGSKD